MADPYEILVASTNQLYNAASLYNDKQNAEAALEQNQNQFDANMQWLREQAGSNLEFANRQHSEQMDFANRNLNANIEIANKNFGLQQQNYELEKEAYNLNKEQLNYQKELNNTQMEREDSAMQRLVSDYKKAGFSPLAAIGSSGAASSALSAGNALSAPRGAPQLDLSGMNQAAGQYMDYAKQYAALTMQANQNYMNNRSQFAEKHNAEVLAAKQALIQMKQDARFKAQSMSTEMFNAAVNYRDSMLNRDYIREQTSYLEDKHKWEQTNGYRAENVQSALVAAIKEYLNSKSDAGTTIEKAFDLSGQMVSKAEEIISDGSKKVEKTVLDKIYNSDLKNWQKTALTFYVTSIKLGFQENRYVKGMRAMFNAGKSLYYKVFGDD